MKKIVLFTFVLCSYSALKAQVPDTDIFLVGIKTEKGQTSFGKPLNITDRPGYDNQPVFSPDNREIIFVSMEDTIQSDLFVYDLEKKTTAKIAETPESEYSPNFMNGNNGISMVRVDSDKGQRFYKYETSPADAELLIDGIDSVGYYCWLNDTTVALVVLNNGLELYVYEIYSHQFIVAAKNVGRCLLRDPETGNLIYTKESGGITSLMMLNTETFESEFYANGYKEAKDYVIAPGGELWAGWEGKLYATKMSDRKEWIEKADFTESVGNFYRIAISGDGRFMALVAYRDKRP